MKTRTTLTAALTITLTAALTTACNGDADTGSDAGVETPEATGGAQAPPDETCPDTPCAREEICDVFTRRCRPGHVEGEACMPGVLFNDCLAGLVCDSVSERCAPPAAEGEACGTSMDCASFGSGGLTCDRSAGQCVRWGALPEGAACLAGLGSWGGDAECAPGLFCGPAPVEGDPPAPGDDELTAGSRCRRPGAQGETCFFDVPDAPPSCQPDLVCTSRDGGVHASCEPRDH